MNEKEQLLDDLATLSKFHQNRAFFRDTIGESQDQIERDLYHFLYQLFNKNRMITMVITVVVTFILLRFVGVYSFFALIFAGLALLVVHFIYKNKEKDLSDPNSSLRRKESFVKIENDYINSAEYQALADKIHQAKQGIKENDEFIKNSDILERIPRDYSHFDAASNMFTYIFNKRADNLKEAINLYENEAHRARMEGTHLQMLANTEQAAIDARSAKNMATIGAVASTINTVQSFKK